MKIHRDVPYTSSASVWGWVHCRECQTRGVRAPEPGCSVWPKVKAWHERVYAEMWHEFVVSQQRMPK